MTPRAATAPKKDVQAEEVLPATVPSSATVQPQYVWMEVTKLGLLPLPT